MERFCLVIKSSEQAEGRTWCYLFAGSINNSGFTALTALKLQEFVYIHTALWFVGSIFVMHLLGPWKAWGLWHWKTDLIKVESVFPAIEQPSFEAPHPNTSWGWKTRTLEQLLTSLYLKNNSFDIGDQVCSYPWENSNWEGLVKLCLDAYVYLFI